MRRVQSGQAGATDDRPACRHRDRSRYQNLGDWTDRIAKGELPHAKPTRPQGVERNIVVTLRDWMDDKHYLHDLITSDKRYPTVNGYGRIYGSPEYSSDFLPILDPVKNTATTFHAPVRDEHMPLSLGPGHAAGLTRDAAVSRTGAAKRSGTRASTITTPCWTGPAGLAGGSGARAKTIRSSANRVRITRRPSCSRWNDRIGRSRCSTRRRRSTTSSIPASARTIRSSASTPTTRCGPAAAVRWSAG